ncbi:hypothetical protein F2Q69_00025094 [Brassica cretica]|uniref:Uncharacterized protein n=1 Tax=Brassica cretica TaxID=69181 RepID=A0A8S9Q4T5_BRACR|nr:hypothetical protein F2Q69_00025094 [Brassica cretica]
MKEENFADTTSKQRAKVHLEITFEFWKVYKTAVKPYRTIQSACPAPLNPLKPKFDAWTTVPEPSACFVLSNGGFSHLPAQAKATSIASPKDVGSVTCRNHPATLLRSLREIERQWSTLLPLMHALTVEKRSILKIIAYKENRGGFQLLLFLSL